MRTTHLPKLSDIKQLNTKRGVRHVVTVDCPAWFWDIPKSDRPECASVFKGKNGTWYLSIWGETPLEVQRHFGALVDGRSVAPAPTTPAPPPPPRRMRDTTPDDDVRIEYPSRGATYCRDEYGVYKYGTYPERSVLAGQQMRTFVDSFGTLEEALAKYPHATTSGCGFRKPYLGHLPADGDPDELDW